MLIYSYKLRFFCLCLPTTAVAAVSSRTAILSCKGLIDESFAKFKIQIPAQAGMVITYRKKNSNTRFALAMGVLHNFVDSLGYLYQGPLLFDH
jgi:hypothetical protein